MRVLIFVTDDGGPNGTGPMVFLPESPTAALPPHPRSLSWKYFATVGDDEALLGSDADATLREIRTRGYAIANRMIAGPSLTN